jgi:dTDP-4-dehydrorhamnose reductase
MAAPDLLVLGATSMVGSHFVAAAGPRVIAAGRTDPASLGLAVAEFQPLDMTDPARVATLVRGARPQLIVNFAALTEVDAIERERPISGAPPDGPAWRVNALAPEALAHAAARTGKYLLHVSTDFVFDGAAGPYDEAAPVAAAANELSWYGWTKREGEVRARRVNDTMGVVRIANPYRSDFPPKLDFARWIVARRRAGTLPPLFDDQTISPTWIPDVSRAVEALLGHRVAGTFHCVSPELTTPYEFGRALLAELEGGRPELAHGPMAAGTAGRAPRPRHGGLIGDRLERLGVTLTRWQDGARQLARAQAGA